MPCRSNYRKCPDSGIKGTTYYELYNVKAQKAYTLADIEDGCRTPDVETKAEWRRKSN
jgi:hypothetical protein